MKFFLSKSVFIFLCICFSKAALFAQSGKIDSLHRVLKNAGHDTTIAFAYVALTEHFAASKLDTVIPLCKKALAIIERNFETANDNEKHSYLFTKAAAINNIAYVHYVKGEIEKAIDYFKKGLEINEQINVPKEIANSLSNLGAIYDQQARPGEALDYLNRALKIQQRIGAKEGMAYTLNNLAAIYSRQGQIEKTLEVTHQSLKLQEEVGNKHGIATSLNNLGALYAQMGQRDKAMDYYSRSLKIREDINDKLGIATCLHNIGEIYQVRNEIEKALASDFRALKIFAEIGDTRGAANLYHNIAAIYEKQGKLKEAMSYYERAIAIHDSIGDKRGLANSLNNIGLALLRSGDPKKAKEYTLKGLAAATEGRYVESLRASHFGLAKIDSATGDNAGALLHYKIYIQYRDSIVNEQTRKAALKKQLLYDYEKKEEALKREQEKKNAIQNAELEKQNIIKWTVAGGSALLLLVAFLLFNRYTLRQRNKFQLQLTNQQKEQANAVMETQESERKRIAEDIHDSLGHLLSTVKLNLQSINGEIKQVENSVVLLNQASEEIRNITFNLMPRTLEEGGLVPALNELASKVTTSGAVKVNLHVHDIEKFILEKQSQFNIYRIIQEAVNNILKHADAKEINIQLVGQSDHITIMIEDDGKGFTPGENKKGRGLKNIVTRSLWLKGSLNIDSTPGRGTTITGEIPV